MLTHDECELKLSNCWRLNKGNWEYFLQGKYISALWSSYTKNFSEGLNLR